MYAALSGTFFLLAVDLQQALRYSPLAAGASLFPVTVIMLVLSFFYVRRMVRLGDVR